MKHNLLLPTLACSVSLLAACSGSSSDEDASFLVRSTNVATAASSPVAIHGNSIAFLAAEDATSSGGNPGTDLNGDGDVADGVVHVVNSSSRTEFRLGVAATALAWAGASLYFAVDEAQDGRDWNGDTLLADDVLLHWSEAAPTTVYVDDLATDAERPFVALNGRLVYAAKSAGANPLESNLRFLEPAAPLVPVAVLTRDTVGPLFARLLGEDEELVFLTFDETSAGRDLNGDGDDDDEHVLGLLDGKSVASVARSTGLAVDPTSPRRARSTGANDWRVGFLVDEAAQGGVSRNSSAVGLNFRPSYCAANDTDAADDVLAVLEFAEWDLDPVANPPINHGLAGRDRLAFAGNYVATIVAESDDNCDLNDDGDTADRVVRWMQVADDALDPLLPVNVAAQVRALFDAPGGGHGLYELLDRFVIVASESAGGNIDANNSIAANLVGWLAPATLPPVWDFTHGDTNTQYVEASWVAALQSQNRLGLAFTERIGGSSLNQGTSSQPGDADVLDSIPVFATFSAGRMVFPGVALAVDSDNAGIAMANNWSFYRMNEVEDSRDLNSDGDKTDLLLYRTNLTTGATIGMSVLVNVQRDAVHFARFGARSCAACFAPEAAQGASGADFNGDGDRTDVVLRWFRF
ncbi:MAG: hypothetical protein JNK02_14240 [Planctomycetes bacterium]|nr:hypothetical protein [Planctomycetota bacterium]